MADIRYMTMPRFRAFDANGDLLGGGKVYVYAAGTSTKISTWQDANKNSKNTNPVVLDSEGYADIFFDQEAKIVLDDSDDVQQWSLDNVSPLNAQTVTGRFNLIPNGSFELDGDGDGDPDDWSVTLFNSSTSTAELDSTEVVDGVQSMKFTSQGDGGGSATSATFGVPNGGNISLSFWIKSSVADVRNIVEIEYLDKDSQSVSTATAYDKSTGNPTSLTRQTFSDTVPGAATQARVKITGCDQSDSTSGTAWFDFVQLTTQSYIFTGTAGEVTASAANLNNLDGSSIDTDNMSNFVLSGEVRMYGGSSEPSGWKFCNGQAISRSTFSKLFNVIGTTFGNGDGSTTFNVPDLRDRSPLGDNTMGASDAGRVSTSATTLGDSGGTDEHQLTEAELPNVTGSFDVRRALINGGNTAIVVSSDSPFSLNNQGSADRIDGDGSNASTAFTRVSIDFGSDNAHPNMHPFLAINFIIKT